jgi:type III secretion system YscQ/HrcQ family protein
LRLSLRLGRTRLSLRELRSLAPGDALRIWPRLPVAESRPRITLTDGAGFALQARLNADELILEHPVNMPEDTPPPTQGDPAGINADDMFSEIECDVSFELGALRMKVSDLARLRAGFAVRLGVRLVDQPVRIMVSGRMLGRGALAALGDELVVVVTETKALPEL